MKIKNVDKLKKIMAEFEASVALTVEDFATEKGYTVGYADWKLSEIRRALKRGDISASTNELFEKTMNTSKQEAKKLAKMKASIPVPVTQSVANEDNENYGTEVVEEATATV
jgi:hypothetical protein